MLSWIRGPNPVPGYEHRGKELLMNSFGRAWRELVLMTILFLWALYMLATQGFGLFTRHVTFKA
jgi:hypothetical protein